MSRDEADKFMASLLLRLAEGYQDGDMVPLDVDYLIEAGQCRRIAEFLLRPEAATGWRPMESAPKGGVRVLAYWPDGNRAVIVSWGQSEPFGTTDEWVTDSEGPGYSTGFEPKELSGWMPLPVAALENSRK